MAADGRRNCDNQEALATDFTDSEKQNYTDTANCEGFWNCHSKPKEAPDRISRAIFTR